MGQNSFSIKKVASIYGGQDLKNKILELEKNGEIPESKKFRSGAIYTKGWGLHELPAIGEKIGFIKKFNKPISLAVFTTKGGVLKSTMALNLARTAALHGIKTCVVGLDIQGDITTSLGHDNEHLENEELQDIIERLNKTKGLSDLFNGSVRLNEIISKTELPNLYLIPETPELVALNDSLGNIHRREYWLKEKVVDSLKGVFDLVIMDCSPNWNKLTTNALVACDALISPLECKINNFRNFKVFRQFLKEFKEAMKINFESIFIPTRYSLNRKLSLEILSWYKSNVSNCTDNGVRESVLGEEATALNLSLIEHVPNNDISKEMRNLISEIYDRIEKSIIVDENKVSSEAFVSNHENKLNEERPLI